MKALQPAHFGEKSSNGNLEDSIEEIKAEFKKACVAFMAVGKELSQLKDDLGKQFYELIDEIGLARSDTNKIIKLFEYFGDTNPKVLEVGPLPLLRLCVSNYGEARQKLHERLEEDDKPITQQDVDAIRVANKPLVVPRRLSKNSASMVGNQPGGTAIFRMEVKDGVLASECQDSFKQSGGTFDSWMRQLLSSFGLVGELANAVLGKGIAHVSDIELLKSTLVDKNLFVSTENQSTSASSEEQQTANLTNIDYSKLPSVVQECVDSLLHFDKQVARYTGSSKPAYVRMLKFCLDDQRGTEKRLRLLCEEFGLDYQSVIAARSEASQFCTSSY